MKSLALKIKNEHNRQVARLRVIVTETDSGKKARTRVLKPIPDDGKTPVVLAERHMIGGYEYKIELTITPSEFPPFAHDSRSA